MGAFWAGTKYENLLSAGTHGTTYGGNPLACAVAQAVLDVVEEEQLEKNVRLNGEHLYCGLQDIQQKHEHVVADVRGLGFMVGLVLREELGDASAGALVEALHQRGMLTVPAGANVCRLLPALNTTMGEIDECLMLIDDAVEKTFL